MPMKVFAPYRYWITLQKENLIDCFFHLVPYDSLKFTPTTLKLVW